MLDPLVFYIPEDRRQAIAGGKILEGRMQGAALYADISGFTPLTEALVNLYGPQLGAEELTSHLDRVYNTLIQQLHQYQGSVIGYSGDAITCWFHEDDGHRAIATALGMHAAMKQLAAIPLRSGETISVAVKVAIVVGEGQRMLVGDPAIQLLDLLGFPVVEHLAVAAQVVHSGEIVVDEQTATRLQDELIVGERRQAPDASEAFIIVQNLKTSVPFTPWPELDPDSLKEEQLRPWVLPAIYERMRQGYSQFMTELRPTVALFLQLRGIDFDHDPQAGAKLNSYVCWVQSVLARFEGVLLQVILGEKGNYLYGTFGAPVVHEDDARRAVSAALELLTPPESLSFIQPVSIGLSRGTMRTGPIGSTLRHTYSVMGDDVNVAARLMEAAAPGELLVTDRVIQSVEGLFKTQRLPALKVKGKTMPIPVYRVLSAAEIPQPARSDTGATLVGRTRELAQLDELTRALMEGQSHVLVIEGEAGIGKSQLLTSWLEASESSEIKTLTGASDAIEQSTPYHAWRSIFSQLLQWDALPQDRQTRRGIVIERLQSVGLESRAPLLNVVLPLDFPDNDLTAEMTGKVRADNTSEVMVTLLGQAALTQPLRIIIEDSHWMDSASRAFTQAVIRQVQPLLLVLVTRPVSNDDSLEYQALFENPNLLRLQLQALTASDTIGLVCQRLGVDTLPEPVTALILEKAEGHPFFSEELAYALRDSGVLQIADRGAHITAGVDIKTLNLPDTVEGVVTSRIDLLTPGQQLTVKVASVIGRIFAYRVLEQVHPVSSDRPRLPDYLDRLQNLDVTPLATPPPDLSYMFKHIIIQEVAYNLLLFEQRRHLHRAVAEWYESEYEDDLSPSYPILAHHWGKANHPNKTIIYLEKAGEQALQDYANQEAVQFFSSALQLADESGLQVEVDATRRALWNRKLGQAHHNLGNLGISREYLLKALRLLKRRVPENQWAMTGSLVKQALIQVLSLLGLRLNISRPSDKKTLLEASRSYAPLVENYYYANETLPLVYVVLNMINVTENIEPSPELAKAYATMCAIVGTIPIHSLAKTYGQRARDSIGMINDLSARVNVLLYVAVYYVGIGDWEQVEKDCAQASEISSQLGDTRLSGECSTALGTAANYRGQFSRSIDLFKQVYRSAQKNDNVLQQAWALSGEACAQVRLGNFDAANSQGQKALTLLKKTVDRTEEIRALGSMAVAFLRTGHYQLAYKTAVQARDLIALSPPTVFSTLDGYSGVAEVFLELWEMEIRTGQPDLDLANIDLRSDARNACKALEKYARVFPIGQPSFLLCRGLYESLSGRQSQSQRSWKKSFELAKEMGMTYAQGRAQLEIVRHLSPDHPERGHHIEMAENCFSQTESLYELEQLKEIRRP